jgi:hypothetical protein
MRDFYEAKLQQMEETLQEKEIEREHLRNELETLKAGGGASAASQRLETQLLEKESHIAVLRKKQTELRSLTAFSSRNDAEISRLQSDVLSMKQKKVDLQKQISEERKQHALEVKELKKISVQQQRELNKWKKSADQFERQAQTANQIAKSRLDELGHLRTKYRDVEKQVRTMSVKHGVLAKAGVDSILIGRRGTKRSSGDEKRSLEASSEAQRSGIDVDTLRDHFDKKVADVVRKEALANKLALEWEEHFQLSAELTNATTEEDDDDFRQTLQLRLIHKEECIRKLAGKLGRKDEYVQFEALQSDTEDNYVFDAEYSRICHGM